MVHTHTRARLVLQPYYTLPSSRRPWKASGLADGMDRALHTVQPVAGAITLQYLLLPFPWLTQQKMGHPVQQKHIFLLAYYAGTPGTA